jgi:deoxyribodipyrimidine photo-lyase
VKSSIVWFRQDLRLSDQPALARAIESGCAVIPVYIWAPHDEGQWAPGGATRWWLHHALADLDAQLRDKGSRLVIFDAGERSSLDVLLQLVRETDAEAVYWNRRYELASVARDTQIKAALKQRGIGAVSCNSAMLHEPTEIANKAGKPFRVFTPMWRHYQTLETPRPVAVDLAAMKVSAKWPDGSVLELLPRIRWDGGFNDFWGTPSRQLVDQRVRGFIENEGMLVYEEQRDLPAEDGTSRLSPYLHFGQIGPRELWWQIANSEKADKRVHSGILRQLVWREFAHHLLFHFPQTPMEPLRDEFKMFPWQESERFLEAWKKGQTGYPIVDAGMRQLWQTGWMHNRVRMIVGSLLVKHLLQHWIEGEKWFWDTLVDADLANNVLGWQWIAGCGADAAPYFRIFNPMTQGAKFDAKGDYVRKYVPELARVPAKFIHEPWAAGDLELAEWGVRLGKDYPVPVIGHKEGRERALAAFQSLKNQSG